MRPCASTARRPSCTTALEQCAATGRIVQRRDAITDAEIVKHDFTSLLRYLIPMARIMLLCLALVPNSLGLNVGNGPLTRPPALRAPKPTAAGAALRPCRGDPLRFMRYPLGARCRLAMPFVSAESSLLGVRPPACGTGPGDG